MRTSVKAVAASLLTLALVAGNVALCAGWAATPEARMACCLNEATCPMHPAGAPEEGATRAISQADADSCCAASEPERSGPSSPVFVPAALVPLSTPTPPVMADALRPRAPWLTDVPIVANDVPTHLLLSVLLV